MTCNIDIIREASESPYEIDIWDEDIDDYLYHYEKRMLICQSAGSGNYIGMYLMIRMFDHFDVDLIYNIEDELDSLLEKEVEKLKKGIICKNPLNIYKLCKKRDISIEGLDISIFGDEAKAKEITNSNLCTYEKIKELEKIKTKSAKITLYIVSDKFDELEKMGDDEALYFAGIGTDDIDKKIKLLKLGSKKICCRQSLNHLYQDIFYSNRTSINFDNVVNSYKAIDNEMSWNFLGWFYNDHGQPFVKNYAQLAHECWKKASFFSNEIKKEEHFKILLWTYWVYKNKK